MWVKDKVTHYQPCFHCFLFLIGGPGKCFVSLGSVVLYFGFFCYFVWFQEISIEIYSSPLPQKIGHLRFKRRLNSSVERGGIGGRGVCECACVCVYVSVCVCGGLVQTKNLPCEGYGYIFSGAIHWSREKTLFIKNDRLL